MGTICVITLSLVCYMFKIDFLRGVDPGKIMENMGGNMGKVMEKSWNIWGEIWVK